MTDDRPMWGDEPLDETMREAAARYNEPGEVPRDAMWARIEAARAVRVIPLAPPAPRPGVRRWHRVAAGAVALAATLLVGVAIGRLSREVPAGPALGGPAAGTGSAVASGSGAPDETPPLAGGSDAGTAPAPAAEPSRRPGIAGRELAATPAGGEPRPATAGPAPDAGVPDAPRSADSAPSVPYRLAAVQHMSRAEALLTTFRAGARAGEVDPAIQPWARDLLTGTRLLIDSPAAGDPELRALLGELELVLAQIVQLSAQRRAEEVQIIDRQLDADGVITRLRTAVPSGTFARGA